LITCPQGLLDQVDAHKLNEAYAGLRLDTGAGLTLPPAGQRWPCSPRAGA